MSKYVKNQMGVIVNAETGKPADVGTLTVGSLEGEGGQQELIATEDGKHFLLKETADGGFYEVPIRDVQQYIAQRNPRSSEEFIAKSLDERESVQGMRRQAAFRKELQGLVKARVDATTVNGHRFVKWKDEKVLDAQRSYAAAEAIGQGRSHNFQPIATYHDKISRVRPIYKGEVGLLCDGGDLAIRQGKQFWIVTLEDGYDKNFVAVGAKIR